MGNIKVKNIVSGVETVMSEEQADNIKNHPKLSAKFKFEPTAKKPKEVTAKPEAVKKEGKEETKNNSNTAVVDKKD